MPRPGVEVPSRAERPRRGLPTDTGVLFVELTARQGPVGEPVRVTSYAEAVEAVGPAQPHNRASMGALEAAFATGVATAYLSRSAGAGADRAAVVLDAADGDALRVLAIGPGAYANGWTVEVTAGPAGDAVTLILRDGSTELERYTVADADDAVRILTGSRYLRGELVGDGGVLVPAGPAALAGGDDDLAGVTDAVRDAALAVFGPDLGPGQVIAPERTDAAGHAALAAHVEATGFLRSALADPPLGASDADLIAARGLLAGLPGGQGVALFADWLQLAGTGGSTRPRAVPPSGVVAGLIARGDAENGVGDAPAFDRGFAPVVLGLAGRQRTPDEWTALNAAGVNVFRTGPRGTQLYGFRSVSSDPAWPLFTYHRLRMSLTARLAAAAEPFLGRSVDGRGLLFADLRAALLAVMAQDYARGDLFGETPEEAFDVTVEQADLAALETGDVFAVAEARFSPFVERARVALVKAALTTALAA